MSSPSKYEAPPSSRIGFQSSIPRLRTRLYNDGLDSLHNDDSDFEHQFEVESRDRRKLTVTNAEVFVSESSSESDNDKQGGAYGSGVPGNPGLRYKEKTFCGPVGLGLSFPRSPSTPKEPRQHRSLVAKDEVSRRVITPEKNLRFSLPPSDSGGSSYSSDEFGNVHPGLTHHSGRHIDDHNWRQGSSIPTDVAQAFDDQNLRYPFTQPHRIVHDECLRRSSALPTTIMGVLDHDEETESDREGYSIQRSKIQRRRRSSSWTPSFRMSPVELGQDDSYINEPPRPRSACQRYDADTPNDMTITGIVNDFPQTLKELIKKRHSKNGLYDYPQEVDSRDYQQTTKAKRQSTHEFDAKHSEQEKWVDSSRRPDDVNESDAWSYMHAAFGRERQQTQTEMVRAEGYRSAAARERLAFGIPPSESDEVYSKGPSEHELPHVESDMSSINESLWRQQRECEGDTKADSLLRQLDNAKESRLEKKPSKVWL